MPRAALLAAAAVLAAAAPAAAADPAKAPNVLFCIADDASPHFGCYGVKWVKTPAIDRLAAGGLVFDNVYTPTAKCAPSRAPHDGWRSAALAREPAAGGCGQSPRFQARD